ncbi:MAG: hypothetical protein ACRC1T_04850 [Clostridium chrysemydis]|uniref:hypothetical protein n=1 Tax=Clostridium chrysemydis TaxID=2665504 RepID=UPI003F3B75AF
MKKHVIRLNELIKEFGYWSTEVFNYNNELLQKYDKYTVSRIEASAKLMLQTGKYKLINP